MNTIIDNLSSNAAGFFYVLVSTIFLLLYLKNSSFRRSTRIIVHTFFQVLVLRVGRLFFLDVGRTATENARIRVELMELREQIHSLTRVPLESIEVEASRFLDSNLNVLIKSKLEKGDAVEKVLLKRVDETVRKATVAAIADFDIGEISQARATLLNVEARQESLISLEKVVDDERKSVSTLRTVMINLFVLFNVSLLVGYFLVGPSLSQYLAISIAVTYLSLAVFIIYIVRTSHFRSGVLLAIQENIRNQAIMMQFLDSCSESLTDADAEIARILTINRTEREHQAQHPYELILKNVSGTNIQFRGGKVQVGGAQ